MYFKITCLFLIVKMSSKRTESSQEIRNLVISHFQSGLSQNTIAQIVERPRTTVQYIINKFKNQNTTQNLPRTGRPRKFNEANERWLVREIKKNPRLNASILSKNAENLLDITSTPQTIRNVLKKNDYRARSARKKPYISKKNQKARLEFALAHINKPIDFWKDVIFTDESKYNIFGCDGKAIVYRKPNTELEERNCISTVKHGGGGVLVWGCMAYAGVGNLTFIEGNMDHMQYIDILKNNLPSVANKFGISSTYKLYQDNDPKHSAQNTRLWTLYNCPNVIKTPAQSPDLNPIEHLWALLETKIRKREFSSKPRLKEVLQEEWSQIETEYVQNLVTSMPRRLKEVIKRKGKATKY